MLFLDKRGVNPLIATVLLLAFAVALATVVWNIQLFDDPCEDAGIRISQMDGKPRLCYEAKDRNIIFFIENGPYAIEGMKFSASGTKNVLNVNEVGVIVDSNNIAKVSVPYDKSAYGEIVSIKVTPKITHEFDTVECPLQNLVLDVQDC